MIGVLKDHLDPGVVAGTGRGAQGICGPCSKGRKLYSLRTKAIGSCQSSRVFPGPWAQGSGPEEPSQALPQPLQHPRVLQKTSLARCLGPHSLIILMPKCIKEAW